MISSFSLCFKFHCKYLQCTRENLNYCLTSSFPEIILGPSVVDTRYHSVPSLEKGGGGTEELLIEMKKTYFVVSSMVVEF